MTETKRRKFITSLSKKEEDSVRKESKIMFKEQLKSLKKPKAILGEAYNHSTEICKYMFGNEKPSTYVCENEVKKQYNNSINKLKKKKKKKDR